MRVRRSRVFSSLSANYPLVILLVANVGGPIRKRGRGFQSSAGLFPLPGHPLRPESDAQSCHSGGNEGGVSSEQTYDRVESAQVRDLDTRAARCEHSHYRCTRL
jgi:hypothetical protein